MTILSSLPSLKETIDQYGLMAKKSLGQNFLLNMDVTRRVARAAGNLTSSTVVEIGPGPGGLTRALLEFGANKVIAIERDDRCVSALQPLIEASEGRLSIISEDALKVRPQDLSPTPIKIVANLPYNIGTLLLTRWLEDMVGIESMTLMFQKEVALRLVAKPRTKDYGRLSVLTQYLTHATKVFDLAPGNFTPPPKVTSSVVHLIPKNLTDGDRALIPTLSTLTQRAFGQRRKMLRASLKGYVEESTLVDLNIAPTARAEELSVDQFIQLAKNLKVDD